MDKDTTVLLIDVDAAGIDSIRRILGDQAQRFKLRRVDDVPTALARIWGGGVGVVLLNLAAIGAPTTRSPAATGTHGGDRLAPFRELRAKTQGVPIVILCDSADESLAESALAEGAADYLTREACDANLLGALRSVAGKAAVDVPHQPTGKDGKIVVCMGSKGGVGTTTVALNVAAALARDRRVILLELHAELGSLALYLQPHRSVRDIGDLLHAESPADGPAAGPLERRAESRAESIPLREVESSLWPVKSAPGLQVLYGSRNPESTAPLAARDAVTLLALCSEIADYVVVDLPLSLSETTRAVMEYSDCLALIVEREPLAAQAARLILNRVDSWKAARLSIGAVIVNRAALVSPMSFAEIDAELRIPTLGIIPPAADLCAAAQHAHSPLVALDADSLASLALRDLAQAIAELVPLAWSAAQAETGPLAAYHASQKMTRAGVR